MSANGRLPGSELAPIGGGYYLRKDAAAAFNAMSAESVRRYGTRITVVSAYRDYNKQVYLWNLYLSGRGNLAAHPGSSNHGWGLAVDLSPYRMRTIVDAIGAPFGFSKSWSDAQSEWWHIVYQPGHYHGKPPSKWATIRRGARGGAVYRAQTYLKYKGFFHWRRSTNFGPLTQLAVKRFQKSRRLPADGVVGPKTWAALRARHH